MPNDQRQDVEFIAPESTEKQVFNQSLKEEPYGITLAPETFRQFRCSGGVGMLAFNQAFAVGNPIKMLRSRKTLLGVVAAKNQQDGRYSVSCLVLTAPTSGSIVVHIRRIGGQPAWAGIASRVSDHEAKFFISTAGRIGIVPMEIEAHLHADGTLALPIAVSGLRVIESRHPVKLN